MDVVFWVSENGENPYIIWKKNTSGDKIKMAESMIACLKYVGIKCRFVKDLKLEGLYELKTKSQQIRVYFFVKKRENTAYIVAVGDKKSQKLDIINAYNRMNGGLV